MNIAAQPQRIHPNHLSIHPSYLSALAMSVLGCSGPREEYSRVMARAAANSRVASDSLPGFSDSNWLGKSSKGSCEGP